MQINHKVDSHTYKEIIFNTKTNYENNISDKDSQFVRLVISNMYQYSIDNSY